MDTHIAILGRQPALGMAELEMLYGSDDVRWFSEESALVTHSDFNFERLGGSPKAGRVTAELTGDWHAVGIKVVQAYQQAWTGHEGKITLGISAYGFGKKIGPREVQKTGIILKYRLKSAGVSLRLVPNDEAALSTATCHHNKLGLSPNKVELIIVRAKNGKVIVAESVGSQNITALAARDQARPKTDAFVGMLPPKLARMMVNMSGLNALAPTRQRILDPFCGTGVVLQESALLGFDAYGTDLEQKMVDYSRANLEWLQEKYSIDARILVKKGDAMSAKWEMPVHAVVCETYLGQPFSAPPSASKLREVTGNCNHIISEFMKNIHEQLPAGTPVVFGVPAWKAVDGSFTHLPLTRTPEKYGFRHATLTNVSPEQLLYFREDQVVARELLLLVNE